MIRNLLLGGALACLLVPALAGARGTARLVTSDAAEVIDAPVLGLQRTAVPVFGGLALDTSLIADAFLLLNAGARFALAAGDLRFVVGARYAHFVGAEVYSRVINAQAPIVKRFEPRMSGPSAYAVAGMTFGKLLVQLEARAALYQHPYASATLGVSVPLGDTWSLSAEAGTRLAGGPLLKAAAGVRYVGHNLGFSLGAAYLGLADPILPIENFPVVPVVDLWWSFR